MINFGDTTRENIKKHNPNRSQVPDHPYRISIVGGSRSQKANVLTNLISYQPGNVFYMLRTRIKQNTN